MYFHNIEAAKDYLINVGGYSNSGRLTRKYYHSDQEYEFKILIIADRIHNCMETYPKEIYDFLQQHPQERAYTLEELRKMTYVQLSALRKELGIRNHKNKKKVIQVESAPELAEEGRRSFASKGLGASVGEIYLNNLKESVKESAEEYSEEETFLSTDEIISMYGDDLPSLEILASQGIYPDDPEGYKKKLIF